MAKHIEQDAAIMQQCIALALKGVGKVSPNPMVGCVIVSGGKIVGKGFHEEYGGPHAEVLALRRAGARARGGTLYVNLEPCSHHGKTPPCVDAIIGAGIAEVVVAMTDPNPLVSSKGIRRLRRAGIRVRSGILKTEAEVLNERFIHFMRTGFPHVSLKLAMTLDGRIADRRGRSKWITSKESRAVVHGLRAQCDAVMVGAGTIMADDPELTVRHLRGAQPLRIVVDGRLRISGNEKVWSTRAAETLLVTSVAACKAKTPLVDRLIAEGVHVCAVGTSATIDPMRILRLLGELGISSVLLEGGAITAGEFLRKGLVDRVYVFVAPSVMGEGKQGISFANPGGIDRLVVLKQMGWIPIGKDLCITGKL